MRREFHVRFCEGLGVRFPRATRLILFFQYRQDAERAQRALQKRLGRFGLTLHPDKTPLMEFGRFAAQNRKQRGDGKPETFDFLGFTHICATKRNGKFVVLRQTMKKRLRAKVKAVKTELRTRLHDPVPEVGRWLASVVRGHAQYYGVPRNSRAINLFRHQVIGLWYRSLRRRSHKTRLTWRRMYRLARRWIPYVRISHPYPEQRLCV